MFILLDYIPLGIFALDDDDLKNWIKRLRVVFGKEPSGAKLSAKPLESGGYSVVCYFDQSIAAKEYASCCMIDSVRNI